MAWEGIEGHDEIARRLSIAVARGRLSGSYLFVGPDGVGKRSFALALSRAILCLNPPGSLAACGRCPSCTLLAGGAHPDFDIVSKPPDRSTIPLESLIGDQDHRMRDGLCWRLLLRPTLGNRRVALLLDADALSEEAANCLLKTLEEPPDRAVIMLVGTSLERQLPTIRSRCQVVRFGPLDPITAGSILARERPDLEPAALAACLEASGGSLVRARELVDAGARSVREAVVEHLQRQPVRVVHLARDVTAFVETAGKEASLRRDRLRTALGFAVEHLRGRLACPTDPVSTDVVLSRLSATLDALEAIDRNANLAILVDAWAARLH
jgi:DNA polymerase-3 subunit delta'